MEIGRWSRGCRKEKSRIGKTFTQCEKGSAEGKVGKISRKIVRSRTQNEEKREKSGLHRAKNERDLSKNRPKSGSKLGKARKTEILERKRRGGGEAKKWALLPILQCYEVAKWVQMKFSRNFFSSKSCREWRNALPLHSQSGSNALAREGYALKAPRQRKRCCDL